MGGAGAGSGGVPALSYTSLSQGCGVCSYPASELPSPSDASCPAPQGGSTGSTNSNSSPAKRTVKAALSQPCLSALPCFTGAIGTTSLSSSSGVVPQVWRESKSGFFLQKVGLEQGWIMVGEGGKREGTGIVALLIKSCLLWLDFASVDFWG